MFTKILSKETLAKIEELKPGQSVEITSLNFQLKPAKKEE